jgi:hypothetical protein
MDRNRKGTICLLGAGASADAGYPMASDLLERFRERMQRLDDGYAYIAPNGDAPSLLYARSGVRY